MTLLWFRNFSEIADNSSSSGSETSCREVQRGNICMYIKLQVAYSLKVRIKNTNTKHLNFKILYLKDGKKKIVQQWLDVHGTNGVYGKKFNIPIDANLGTWRIVVDVLVTLI